MILGAATVAIIGVGGSAFAGWNMGYGPHGRMGGGLNSGGTCLGQRYHQNLSQEDVQKIHRERSAFFTATDDLRREIYAKGLELEAEIVKKTPDTEKAVQLQKELSGLRAAMDQKRVEHMVKMRGVSPNTGMGFAGGCPGRGVGGYGG